ncbi:rho GTPase-activating protein 190-like [Artemia franciscana]|uniref:rho GTPase-activating protein 190-like n=1 Tax=Artemia franciscana TaxID=6661 RepID=UPI0032DAA834
MTELEDVALKSDRSCRLVAIRSLLQKFSPITFGVLKFIFQHLVRVAENSRVNNMDSKNIAICWWPTLLPFEFSDMTRFECMRPHMEEIVQAMIDQYPFLFLNKDEVLMV